MVILFVNILNNIDLNAYEYDMSMSTINVDIMGHVVYNIEPLLWIFK